MVKSVTGQGASTLWNPKAAERNPISRTGSGVTDSAARPTAQGAEQALEHQPDQPLDQLALSPSRATAPGKQAQSGQVLVSKAALTQALQQAEPGLRFDPGLVASLGAAAAPILDRIRGSSPAPVQRLSAPAAVAAPDDAAAIADLKAAFQAQLRELATRSPADLRAILQQAFGGKLSPAQTEALLAQARAGQFPLPPQIQFLDDRTLQGANAAFSPQEGGTLFLNRNLLNDPAGLLASFTEEAAHFLDQQLGGPDSAGDEGEVFRKGISSGRPLAAAELALARSDHDQGTITVDGQPLQVEFDDPKTSAQAMLNFVKANFAALSGGDNYISAADLQAARSNQGFGPDQQILIARLQAFVGELEEYANDEIGDENDGITLKDMQALLKQATSQPDDATIRQITRTQPLSNPEAKATLEFFEKNFGKLDADKDGWVSAADLKRARWDRSFGPEDQKILARLQANLGKLEAFSNDETGDENDGITLKDMFAYAAKAEANPRDGVIQNISGSLKARSPQAQQVMDFFETNFNQLDSDRDGWVTAADLKKARKDVSYSQDEQKMLARLQAYLGELEELSNDETGDENDGITLNDMQTYLRRANSNPKDALVQGVAGTVAGGNANAQTLLNFFEAAFQKLDGNKNGWVSLKELDTAISTANQADKAKLLALRAHIGNLEEYSNDESGDENSGITLKDMHAFVRQSGANPSDETIQNISGSVIATLDNFTGRELLDFARDKFKHLDTDKDGFLSVKNLREALEGGGLSVKEQSMALKLMAYIEDVEELSNDETGDENDGVTQADLAKIIQQGEFETGSVAKPGRDFQRMSSTGISRPHLTEGASASYTVTPNLPKPALPAPTLDKNHQFPGAKMDANLYKVDFGGHTIKIYIPTPAVANQPTAQDVLDALAGLPAALRNEIKAVQVSPVANPKDADWAKEYNTPGFVSDMTAGEDRVVDIYNHGSARTVQQINERMLHESGHVYSETGADGFKWSEWKKVMAADMISPSTYAANDKAEDFAESVRLYTLTKNNPVEAAKYQAEFPNRFKWLKDHGF